MILVLIFRGFAPPPIRSPRLEREHHRRPAGDAEGTSGCPARALFALRSRVPPLEERSGRRSGREPAPGLHRGLQQHERIPAVRPTSATAKSRSSQSSSTTSGLPGRTRSSSIVPNSNPKTACRPTLNNWPPRKSKSSRPRTAPAIPAAPGTTSPIPTSCASAEHRRQARRRGRCVVSVSMLTDGWDANIVTEILGVRAFGTQLLCEQVDRATTWERFKNWPGTRNRNSLPATRTAECTNLPRPWTSCRASCRSFRTSPRFPFA